LGLKPHHGKLAHENAEKLRKNAKTKNAKIQHFSHVTNIQQPPNTARTLSNIRRARKQGWQHASCCTKRGKSSAPLSDSSQNIPQIAGEKCTNKKMNVQDTTIIHFYETKSLQGAPGRPGKQENSTIIGLTHVSFPLSAKSWNLTAIVL